MKNYSRHSVGEVPRVPKSPLADDLTGALVVVYKMSIILFVIEREGGLREREGVSAGEGFFFVKVMSFITYLLSNSSTVTSCVVESRSRMRRSEPGTE